MFMAETLKRPVWIAPSRVENGVRVYGTPRRYMLGWTTTSSDADIKAFGPKYVDYRAASLPVSALGDIEVFDRAWFDVTPQEPADLTASNADFFVYAVTRGSGGVARVLFRRLGSDEAA